MGAIGIDLGNCHRFLTRWRPHIWMGGSPPLAELTLLTFFFVYSCSVPFPLSSKPLILSSKPLQNSDSSFIWRILFKILSTFLSRLLCLIFQRKNWWSAMNYLVPTSLTAKGSLHTFDSVFPSIYLIHWNLTLPFLLHRSYFGKSHQWLWAFKSWIQVPRTPFPALFAWLTSMQISRLISLERL